MPARVQRARGIGRRILSGSCLKLPRSGFFSSACAPCDELACLFLANACLILPTRIAMSACRRGAR